MEHPGPGPPFSNFRSRLESRLLDARTVVINQALTMTVAGQVSEQLMVLESESREPILVMISNAPGGDVDAGLSTYDLFRSLTAPVTVLGSGRIAGAGLLAFAGALSDRRFALPHARFRFEEPTDLIEEGRASDLEEGARDVAERRKHIVTLLSDATGQTEHQIDVDLSSERAFDAEEASEYGLIQRVVQSRRDIE